VIQVDNSSLEKIVSASFLYSLDGRVIPQLQDQFLDAGIKLRKQLVRTKAAAFNNATNEVTDANKKLKVVNDKLAEEATALANVAQTVGDVAALVKVLDNLLKLAL
jgi:hypothetical protein